MRNLRSLLIVGALTASIATPLSATQLSPRDATQPGPTAKSPEAPNPQLSQQSTRPVASNRDQLLKITIVDETELEKIVQFADLHPGIVIWSEGVGIGEIDVRVPYELRSDLDATGLSYVVTVDNLRQLQAELFAGPRGGGFFDVYRSYDEHVVFMNGLVAAYPSLAQMINLGSSVEGRPLWAIRITGPGTTKPAVMYHGAQHGNEIIGPCVIAYCAEQLLVNYGIDPEITAVLDGVEWFLLPIMNPDGYVSGHRHNANNYDLNRNWGGPGSNPNPFSQPETAAMRDFFVAHPNVKAHSDLHSYGFMILWPWGHTADFCDDHWTFDGIATGMRDRIFAVRGTDYWDRGPIHTTIYPVHGGSEDYTYGVHGIWTEGFEIGYSFHMPTFEILPTCQEILPSLIYLSQRVSDCNGNGIPDPDEIAAGTGTDCNDNGMLDECEVFEDCNGNSLPDGCDIAGGTSEDCHYNGIPDDCDISNCGALAERGCEDPNAWCQDCNGNGIPDVCDLYTPPGSARNSGNCCEDHCTQGAGCQNPVCEASVCSYDPYCCGNCWDQICADEAAADPNCDCTPGGGATITIKIFTDIFPGETTWQLVQQGGGPVAGGGPYYAAFTLHSINVPVDQNERYDFTIFDAWGDGICCAYGAGWYEVLYDGNLVCSGGAFGSFDVCPDIGGGPESVISQFPNQSNGLFSDIDCNSCGTGIQIVADSFSLGEESTITLARGWGGYFPGNINQDPDYYTVVFRSDAGGLPGATISPVSGPASTKATTGVVLFGVDEYVFTWNLAVTLAPGSYWFEYYNNTAGNPDTYFWEVGNFDPSGGVLGSAWTLTFPEEPWTLDPWTDMAYELIRAVGPSADDCNENCVPDECDIADGTSQDCDGDGTPDECESEVVPCGVLDVKPGGCPNPLNRSSQGFLPVALAGTANFDVTMIDVASVRLSRADWIGGEVAPNEGPPGPHSVFEDVATPFEGVPCDCHDLTGDGLDDLAMKFRTQAVVAALLLGESDPGDDVELVITGILLDGTAFTTGGDCIRIVPAENTGVRAKAGSASQAVRPGFGRRMSTRHRP